MKVLIEENGTGKFLTEKSEWTLDYRKAKDFGQSSLAIRYALKENIRAISLLLVFGTDRSMDVRLEPFASEERSARHSGAGTDKTVHQPPGRAVA
jgi:hypothetical protein